MPEIPSSVTDPSNATRPAGNRHSIESSWQPLRRSDWIAASVAVVFAGVLAWPHLPPSICFSDGGDLQLASVTLGIMHPPGYAGYTTFGWLVSRIPGVDPAYMVTLACLASGLVAIWFCILLQIRLGVSPWIAGAIGLALAAHPRVWSNLVAPEVYAPSLALLIGAGYLLVRFVRRGVRRDLAMAGLLFGFALANRPPLVFTLPFFVIAWWTARTRWERSWRYSLRSLVMGAVCLALPIGYSAGYLWLRDSPDTPYNYIEQHNEGSQELPDSTAGWSAKLDRVVWQASGRQFRGLMGTTLLQARIKLLWLRHELLPPERQDVLAILGMIVVFGAMVTFRRCRATFCVLSGMMAGTLVFIFLYQVFGQAADLLPLILAAAVMVGVALSSILPDDAGRMRTGAAIGLFVLSAIVSVMTVSSRPQTGVEADATGFLEELDMETLPPRAVIAASWSRSTPLWYAKHVLTQRADIDIINIDTGRWVERIAAMPTRPAFVAISEESVEGFTLEPFRNIRRLVPATNETASPSSVTPTAE